MRARRRHHPVALAALAFVLLVMAGLAAEVVSVLVHVLPILVMVAFIIAAAYLLGRDHGRRQPGGHPPAGLIGACPAPAGELASAAADNARLRAEIGQLRRRVADLRQEAGDARAARDAAWDAAASTPPRTAGPTPARDRLIADPRSGARPIGGMR